ncbi:LLM class F420-dependent oxidoreductase [Xylanimonas oleitrophica]|uniref:LLM class F420-dependent oxidoreductase n=1 Tax=Xylanimonas oleitrophica TaxID=2607479 RepID=A0A2W5Y566_9MICO|nr:TIGR03885 family FMN-dependent LLM class oxidoreductase [Xylanimonas oleitrophica]PZR53184.1 LLM class F420-dependent oxidoreductase [Xylanimonas oleitrophica]
MTIIGFHASHEQMHPSDLLRAVQRAEEAGFDAAMCSDHLAPWSRAQGHSGFTWSWLGAALATTSRLTFGTVTAPGQRYHPVVLAHALGTLAAMYPGRVWAAPGSGENLNEHVTGDPWPPKADRDERLRESVRVMRALLAGEEVTHEGHVTAHEARLWTLPEVPPMLVGPAITIETAVSHAAWADGLITTNQPLETLREMFGAYREAGGRGDLSVQVHLSWDQDLGVAERTAVEQWSANAVSPQQLADLPTPQAFEEASAGIGVEEVREVVHVTDSLEGLTDYLLSLLDVGADRVYLHHVSADLDVQERFVAACAEHVLPAVRGVTSTAGPAGSAGALGGTAGAAGAVGGSGLASGA